MNQLLLIAGRSLLLHKRRTFLLGGAITAVTALLVLLAGISVGAHDTMLESATTLMTGHVNVAGFYKVTAGQAAPAVTDYKKVLQIIEKEVPELDFVVQRGRGYARVISDTTSTQTGIAGVDITRETGFKRVVRLASGRLEDLAKPNSVLLFEKQAERLEVKVGDTLTVSTPTFRGTNNTVDVTVVAIAKDMGLLSRFNLFMQDRTLRTLYQMSDDATGALQLYLKDVKAAHAVEERLREALTRAGYVLMAPDPRIFFVKFESVNREDWTGQKLDLTTWDEELSMIEWMLAGVAALFGLFITILMVIICVGIMNIMWITIRERTREIGTLRAIGMQRRRVLAMFVTEGFLLGFVGTVAGGLLGVAAAAILNAARVPMPLAVQIFLMNDHLVIVPTTAWVLRSIALITFAITMVSVIPSFLAARMKPITAMHHIG